MSPLAGRWMKFNRGKEQVDTLQAEIGAFATPPNQKPVGIRQKFDQDRQAWVCTILSVPDCPPHWGLLIGEALHNLRGALDHLIWDLSILHHNGIPRDSKGREWRTQFPICGNNAEWKSPRTEQMVSHVSPSHHAIIEGLQPYHGWQGKRPHPLLSLHALSNTDKHRVLQPAVLAPGDLETNITLPPRDCEVLGEGEFLFVAGRPLKKDTELLRLPLKVTGADPKVEVKFHLSLYIGFSDGMPVEETMEDTVDFVHRTLTVFEGDLTTARAIALREQIDASYWALPSSIPIKIDSISMDDLPTQAGE